MSRILRVRSVNSLGFTAGIRLFFCDQADLRRYSRLKNQSASIDASGSAGFFRQRTPQETSGGGLGVNKRNRGYPADFIFTYITPCELKHYFGRCSHDLGSHPKGKIFHHFGEMLQNLITFLFIQTIILTIHEHFHEWRTHLPFRVLDSTQ